MKKLLSCLVSVGVLASTMMSFVSSTSFAATNVLMGDANNNGSVTYSDYAAILQYLNGYAPVSARSFTAMDVNQDKIIDMTDAYIIQYRLAYNISAPTVQKELYTLPDDSTRSYIKYTCDTGTTTSYTLSNSTVSSNADFDYPVATISDELDNENTNVVHLSCGGSGFVIGEHLIATAAHCVYNGSDNDFLSNITVNIYNEQAEIKPENLIASFEAESYHIPVSYLNRLGAYLNDPNYDYALIYVGTDSQGNDLLDYVDSWQFAIPSLEFSEAETGQLTTTGFTSYTDSSGNECYARYYSTGIVDNLSNNDENNPQLRIASKALNKGGKSGGPMYFTSTYNNSVNKSVVGITTHIHEYPNNYYSLGTKINLTLLRFYKQNPYI